MLLGDQTYDVATRALVLGVLDATGADLMGQAEAMVADGADLLEVPADRRSRLRGVDVIDVPVTRCAPPGRRGTVKFERRTPSDCIVAARHVRVAGRRRPGRRQRLPHRAHPV